MKDVASETARKTAPQRGRSAERHDECTPLDSRYGKIGISAVAAAARYASGASASRSTQEFGRQKSEL